MPAIECVEQIAGEVGVIVGKIGRFTPVRIQI